MKIGDKVDEKYEIKDEIGSGQYGRVYKAVHEDNVYAIKVQSALNVSDEAFDREKELSSKLDHNHVIVPHSVFKEKNNIYSIMDYVEGENLKKVLDKKETFTLEEVIEFARYYFPALTYMHRENVAHRDLKPENIMIGVDNKPYIIDFGSVKFASKTADQSTFVRGAPTYMAPEILKGKKNKYSLFGRKKIDYFLADIYSTGVMFYELLTGEKPVKIEMGQAGITSISKIADIKKHFKTKKLLYPEKLAEVVMKSLDTNPKKRYQTALDFYKALQDVNKNGYKKKRSYSYMSFQFFTKGRLQKLAHYFLDKAACAGDTRAMNDLGFCYYFGVNGYERDWNKAAKWYEEAEKRERRGITNYWDFISEVICSKTYFGKPIHTFRHKKIETSLRNSIYYHGKLLKDIEKGTRTSLEELIGKGDELTEKDVHNCIEWNENAAMAGNIEAMCELGTLYYQGNKYLEADKDLGKYYYHLSGDRGCGRSFEILGDLERKGKRHRLLAVSNDFSSELYSRLPKKYKRNLLFNSSLLKNPSLLVSAVDAIVYYEKAERNGNPCKEKIEKAFSDIYAEIRTSNNRRRPLLVPVTEKTFITKLKEVTPCLEAITDKFIDLSSHITYFMGNIYHQLSLFSSARKWYQFSANQGNNKAMNMVGYYYEHVDTFKSYEEAKKYYQKASRAGNHDAANNLGLLYNSYAKELDVNDKEVESYFIIALERGNKKALGNLARYYYYKKNDITKAKTYTKEAIIDGEIDLAFELGLIYSKGEDQIYWCENVAEHNSKAIKLLGNFYRDGIHRKANFARKHKGKSYDTMFNFSLLSLKHSSQPFEKAYELESDYQNAIYWYNNGSKKNDLSCMIELAAMYMKYPTMCRGMKFRLRNHYNGEEWGLGKRTYMPTKSCLGENDEEYFGRAKKALDIYEKIVERIQDDMSKRELKAEIALKIAEIYEKGYDVQKSNTKAVAWYKIARYYGEKVGNKEEKLENQFFLRRVNNNKFWNYSLTSYFNYKKGLEYSKKNNIPLALAYYFEAIEHASTKISALCAYNIAFLLHKKIPKELRDMEEVLEWYERSSYHNYSKAYMLEAKGDIFRDGELDGVEDIQAAIECYKDAAQLKNISAMNKLGELYHTKSKGIDTGYGALYWYTKAASLGCIKAMRNLGILYTEKDLDIEQDSKQAMYWLKKGSRYDDDECMHHIGLLYQDGKGVKKNESKAIRWFRKSAKHGNSEAAFKLGKLYHDKCKNTEEPYIWTIKSMKYWYEQARKVGHSQAMVELGHFYLLGNYYEHNYTIAQQLYEDAAKNGNLEAMYCMGVLYNELKEKAIKEKKGMDSRIEGTRMYITDPRVKDQQNKKITKYKRLSIKWFKKAANHGYHDAYSRLGRIYTYDDMGRKKYRKAIKWYKKAAKNGDINAIRELACLHFLGGYGIKKNYTKSKICFERGMNLGDAQGYAGMGVIFRDGCGVKQDYARAERYFYEAATKGCYDAYDALGDMYVNGIGVDIDIVKAKTYFEHAVNKGDNVSAMLALAEIYQEGKGDVEKNVNIALDFLTRAAEKGSSAAFRTAAYLFYHGDGVEQSYEDAKKLYEAAVEGGDVDSLYELGMLHLSEKCKDSDSKKGIEYLEKAVVSGNADAYLQLGKMYYDGIDVEVDYQKARFYFENSNLKDNEEAMCYLGCIYANGNGVNVNFSKAKTYFEKLVELGNRQAVLYLGVICERSGSECEALGYYLKSAELGNNDGVVSFGRIYSYDKEAEYPISKVEKVLEEAVRLGSVNAHVSLGDLYLNEKKSKEFDEKAIKLYEYAAHENNKQAVEKLITIYERGQGSIQADSEKVNKYTEQFLNILLEEEGEDFDNGFF